MYKEPYTDYSAMRGPCPDGFHIPTQDEFTAIYNIGETIGAWTSTQGYYLAEYLKLPMAGQRSSGDGNVYEQGTYGYYWSDTVQSNNGRVMYLYFYYNNGVSSINTTLFALTSDGYSVRPIKDTVVVPDSSWTVLYQGTGDAGIYHNSSLGLISISSDGTTRYTIADKNLGATQVYNYGDTVSQANCGNYYQRGNNYGFPRTGSVTTSTTRVDTTGYGPGNYYSSSTFIKYSGIWASPRNDDLRGAVTGTTTGGGNIEPKKIYIRVDVPPELCFTANTAGSTVKLKVGYGSPTNANLETSTDGNNWTAYTIGTTITLSNTGDKVWRRSRSTTDTGFSIQGNYYTFEMTGSIAASGDATYLVNKNGTNTLPNNCFMGLFYGCSSLTSAPDIPATTVGTGCFSQMFYNCTGLVYAPKILATTMGSQACSQMFRGCTSLETIPALYTTSLPYSVYSQMFYGCSRIKIATSQGGDYKNSYRIPITGTGTTTGNYPMNGMFTSTGGTFTGTPDINTTYYTSNTVV